VKSSLAHALVYLAKLASLRYLLGAFTDIFRGLLAGEVLYQFVILEGAGEG